MDFKLPDGADGTIVPVSGNCDDDGTCRCQGLNVITCGCSNDTTCSKSFVPGTVPLPAKSGECNSLTRGTSCPPHLNCDEGDWVLACHSYKPGPSGRGVCNGSGTLRLDMDAKKLVCDCDHATDKTPWCTATCSGHGVAWMGGCLCDHGYGGDDCSVPDFSGCGGGQHYGGTTVNPASGCLCGDSGYGDKCEHTDYTDCSFKGTPPSCCWPSSCDPDAGYTLISDDVSCHRSVYMGQYCDTGYATGCVFGSKILQCKKR